MTLKVLGSTLSKACTTCSNEGCRTAGIAYKLLNLLPVRSTFSHDQEMREELIQFAQQVLIITG